MRILVTGGAGFIGSNFIRHLLDSYADYRVVNFDLLTYAGNPASLLDVVDDPRYEFFHGDVGDASAVRDAMRGCDAVINFAAETHVDRSIIDAGAFVRTNVGGVQTLLEAARDYHVERFVQISTDEVYGSIGRGSFSEADALVPNSPYAASKAGADLVAHSYFATFGVPAIITRSSNNYGPFQFPEKVVPLFVTNLVDGEQLPLYGDGRNVRDWTHVHDNCRAIDVALHAGAPGEIYNIGAGNEVANIYVTHRLLEAFGVGAEMIRWVPDRPGHDRRYSITTEKIRALGWEPGVSLDAGLAGVADWYRANETWWRPLKARAAEAALPATATALRG